jgi:hypothetical protein
MGRIRLVWGSLRRDSGGDQSVVGRFGPASARRRDPPSRRAVFGAPRRSSVPARHGVSGIVNTVHRRSAASRARSTDAVGGSLSACYRWFSPTWDAPARSFWSTGALRPVDRRAGPHLVLLRVRRQRRAAPPWDSSVASRALKLRKSAGGLGKKGGKARNLRQNVAELLPLAFSLPPSGVRR